MADEKDFKRVDEKKEKPQKSKNGLIIIILILLLIIGLIVASFFVKDKEGVLYIDKFKTILMKKTDEKVLKNEDKQRLAEYLAIKEKQGKDKNFKYQYLVFTDKLPKELYEDFLLEQDIFVSPINEIEFEKKELKSHAEIYDDILFICSIQTFHIAEMPVFSNTLTLIIDLKTNNLMKNYDIIAKFGYNPVGLYTKVLEDMLENTKALTYYYEDGETKVSRENFINNITFYSYALTDVQVDVVKFYIKNAKLYMIYYEPAILHHINLEYDKGSIDETEKIIELKIVP